MQFADLMIDQSQQEMQQLVYTYEGARDLEGVFVSAESLFEHDSQRLFEEGWLLKAVSHRGSILSPCLAVVATYKK